MKKNSSSLVWPLLNWLPILGKFEVDPEKVIFELAPVPTL